MESDINLIISITKSANFVIFRNNTNNNNSDDNNNEDNDSNSNNDCDIVGDGNNKNDGVKKTYTKLIKHACKL